MDSRRRHHRSSSRSSADYRPPEVSVGRTNSSRRRRRSRQSERLKRRLQALLFGVSLFAVAGGLLALLVGEAGDSQDDQETVAQAPLARPKATGERTDNHVPVVTCPEGNKRAQHPAYAAACGDDAALKALLTREGAGDLPDPRKEFAGRTALHHAAQRGDTSMLAALLAAGANPNMADAAGDTPLHLVAATHQLRTPQFVARKLIDGGARLDLANNRGLTPIQELETHQQRLLHHQDLAKVLFQAERENQIAQWLTPTVPWGERPLVLPEPEPPGETMEIDTAIGKVRLPVGPSPTVQTEKVP